MTKHKQNNSYLWLALLVALLVFFVTAGIAHRGKLVWGEVGLLQFVYNWPSNWQGVMTILTTLGSLWMVVWLTILALLARNQLLALRLVLAGAGTAVLIEISKQLVGRPRPIGLLHTITDRSFNTFGYGYPSGHTANAVALGLTLWPFLPKRWRIVVPIWILAVALSRLYLGVHAPLDIIGGVCVGVLVALSLIIAVTTEPFPRRRRLANRNT